MINNDPLGTVSQGGGRRVLFFHPESYVNVYDSINTTPYTLLLDDTTTKRIASKLSPDDRTALKEWLVAAGIPETQIDTADTKSLLDLWAKNYDPKQQIPGMTFAKTRYYQRLNTWLPRSSVQRGGVVATKNAQTGALEK